MDLLCGPWGGALCSPQRLLDYLGSISNGYAPFQINYFLHKSQNYQSLIPHNPEVIPCNQEPLPGKKFPISISFVLYFLLVKTATWQHKKKSLIC